MTFFNELERFGTQPALFLNDATSLSYRALAIAADAVFARQGAPSIAGTLVAVECINGLQSLLGYLGALRCGFPVLLLGANVPQDLRDALYQKYRVPHVLSPLGEWRVLEHRAPQVHADLSLLLCTSGSTGSPKLVRLSSRNLQANAESIAHYLELTAHERPITSLPMHYSYGLSVINSHLHAGASIALTDDQVTSKNFWSFLTQTGATSLAGVPATYKMLKQLRFEEMSAPSLRTLTQAGGKLPADLTEWFADHAQRRGARFFVMYGQTEATARMAYLPAHMVKLKPGSIGVAIPGGTLSLVDENGGNLESIGSVGELQYRGPNVMLGYALDAGELALGDCLHNVLLTGDLARKDADGYFYIVGRRSRFIKVLGNRVDLDEVERQLGSPGHEVAAAGVDDLLVVAAGSANPSLSQLRARVCQRYHLHSSVVKIVTMEGFPLSAAGKIQYAEILKAAGIPH
jgi:long-chain acyl-CoA synthetase